MRPNGDDLIGEVLGKGIPRKRSVFGGLASPARFERAASRLGGGPSILLRYGDLCSFLFLAFPTTIEC